MSAESAAANARAEADNRFIQWWKTILKNLQRPMDDGGHRFALMRLPEPDENVLVIAFAMISEKDKKWLAENFDNLREVVKDVGVLQQIVDASKQTSLLSPDEKSE